MRVLFAVGMFGSVTFVLAVLHIPIVIAMIGGLLLSVWAGFSRPIGSDRLKPVPTLLAAIPLFVLAINATIVPLHDFDGRAFWLLKAKAIAHEHSIDGPYFHNEVVHAPRNQYPLLMPIDAAAIMMANGSIDDSHVRWLYLLIFAAFVFVVARHIDPWCAAILAWLPQFAVASEGGALSAYSDIAVAAFITCAFLELIDGDSPVRFGCWLAFLVLTKNEGLPVALILFAIALSRRWWRAAIPLAMAVAALLAWRARIPKTDEEDYLSLLPSFASHLHRVAPAAIEFAKHAFDFSSWGAFWIAAAIALVLVARKEWRAPAVVAAIAIVYIGAYTVTQWQLRDLINVSADRLLMHVSGPALFAIARVSGELARSRYAPRERRPESA